MNFLAWLLVNGFLLWIVWSVVPAYFDRRYERLHREAGGIKYPECPCFGCFSRHNLAARGFASTKEAFSLERLIRTRGDDAWRVTPVRPVPGCSCIQCKRLLREVRVEFARQRDAREQIEIKASPPAAQEWLTGGWP